MSNILDLVDQTFFRGEQATGVTAVLQCVWVYNNAIDIDGLRQFHRHLQEGRLSRRIERSPLPFGRRPGPARAQRGRHARPVRRQPDQTVAAAGR